MELNNNLINRMAQYQQRCVDYSMPLRVTGRVTRVVGLLLEAVGCIEAVGNYCEVHNPSGKMLHAEVVGFAQDKILLMPIGDTRGITPGSTIIPTGKYASVSVSDALLGRVIDGRGLPIDSKGVVADCKKLSIYGETINPLTRPPIVKPLDVGIRSINSLLTIGQGQRIGLFSGSGVGKSVLLGMMTRFTSADVIVVALVGERGREVNDFINKNLGEQGMKRCVLVVCPADDPPLLRLHGAMIATTIAEYFRDQGKHVLLLMDSLTRFAQAQREISLAVGEPPATKGYTPSVFAKLPQLVERAGSISGTGGSITAFYTVLAEGDDQQDPIADAARAILDGHIVLSRDLADAGVYPAIDIEISISRLMSEVVDCEHNGRALQFRKLYSLFHKNQDLISVGAYSKGSDPQLDSAIAVYPRLSQFLCQGINEAINMDMALNELIQILPVADHQNSNLATINNNL